MKLKKISFKNFRLFENFELEFPDENFIVIIGGNGSGKTSILDGIAFCCEHILGKLRAVTEIQHAIKYDLKSEDVSVNKLETNINLLIHFYDSDLQLEVGKTHLIQGTSYKLELESYINELNKKIVSSEIKSIPIIAYFRIDRSKYQDRKFNLTPNNTNSILDNYGVSLDSKHQEFADFEQWFVAESIDENFLRTEKDDSKFEKNTLSIIRKALSVFTNHFDSLNISSFKLIKTEGQKFNPNNYLNFHFGAIKVDKELRYSQLSSGEKAVIYFVTEIARKLCIANSNSLDSLKGNGLVIIDELDLHLHPSWQLQIVDALKATFPNVQFIVTTHSPLVLSNVRREEIIALISDRDTTAIIPTVELENIYSGTADEILQKWNFSRIQNTKFDRERDELKKLIRLGKYDEALKKLELLKTADEGRPYWLLEFERRIAFAKA